MADLIVAHIPTRAANDKSAFTQPNFAPNAHTFLKIILKKIRKIILKNYLIDDMGCPKWRTQLLTFPLGRQMTNLSTYVCRILPQMQNVANVFQFHILIPTFCDPSMKNSCSLGQTVPLRQILAKLLYFYIHFSLLFLCKSQYIYQTF